MGVDVGTATGYLDLDISGFLDGLKSAQSEAQKTTQNMATQIGNGFKGVGQSLTSAGSTLTKSVTTPIIGLGTVIVKTSADFESSMSKVRAISGAAGEDFERLQDKAREMGAKTRFSASEAADAFQYMAMAGWDVENMMGGISGVMNLAAASGEDLATVSDIVTDAMTAFGLAADETSKVLKDGVEVEVDNTTRFVDALAAASNSSNTNVSMLGESFKYVAPVAGALGYSVEDTAIALGLMANQGIKASSAGTALRTVLTNMANPTETISAAMDTLGVSLENNDGSMKSLMEVLQDLRKGFGQGNMDADEFAKSMTELQDSFDSGKISEEDYTSSIESLMVAMYGAEGAQKAQIAAQLAGKEGMAGLLAIVNTGEKDFNNLSDSIYNASGTSQEMADIMNDNLSGQITILLSALQELALQFGEIFVPEVKDAVAWIQSLVAKLQELTPEQKKQIAIWATIAASIGPVIFILGKLIFIIGDVVAKFGSIPGAISKLKASFGLLKGAIAGVSMPIVAIVASIGVLIAAFKHLWDTNEEFRQKMTEIWDGLKSKFADFGQGIVDRLNALGADFESVTEVLSTIWNGFCELLAPVFESAFSIVSSVLGGVLDVITGILDIFIGLFTRNWDQLWNGVKEVFGGIWDAIVGVFTGVMNALKGIADVVLGWFGTSWDEVWQGISSFFIGIWEGIRSFFESVVNGIKTFASNAWNGIKTTIVTVFTAISTFFSTVWNTIRTVVTTVVNGIKSTLSTVWNAIKTIVETVMNTIKTVITNVWNAIKNTISTVINIIKSTIDTVWNAIKTIITNVVNGIKQTVSNVFEGMRTAITNTVNNIKSAVTNTFNNIKSSLTSIADNIKSSVSETFEKLKTAMSDAIDAAKSLVVNTMENAKNGIVDVWNGITDTFAGIGRDVIQGIINGIGSMVSSLYDSIKSALSGLVDKAKNALGIHSPSTVMRDQIGKQLPPGIAIGFESAMGKAIDDIQDSLDDGINSLETKNVSIGIQDNMIKVASMVAEYFETIEDRLSRAVANMRSSLEYLVAVGTAAANGVSIGYVGYNGITKISNGDPDKSGNGDTNGNGGNTYVFYTTKAIDEIEAARQMKRAERDMAEGFA